MAVDASSTGAVVGSESCEGSGLSLTGSDEGTESSPGSYNNRRSIEQHMTCGQEQTARKKAWSEKTHVQADGGVSNFSQQLSLFDLAFLQIFRHALRH